MLDRPTLPLQRSWTEAEDKAIREGRDNGLTSSQIAFDINRTRNAILGRAFRLGLSRGSEYHRMQSTKANRAKFEHRSSPRPLRAKVEPKPTPTHKARPEPSLAPESLNLTCEELQPNSCRYIAGDPKDGGTYCGHRKKVGSSFCAYHHSIVWVRPERMRV